MSLLETSQLDVAPTDGLTDSIKQDNINIEIATSLTRNAQSMPCLTLSLEESSYTTTSSQPATRRATLLPSESNSNKVSDQFKSSFSYYYHVFQMKRYVTGCLFRKHRQHVNGSRVQSREWIHCYAEVTGATLSFWSVPCPSKTLPLNTLTDSEIEKVRTQQAASTLSLTEIELRPCKKHKFTVEIRTAGKNSFYLRWGENGSLKQWQVALQLASFEYMRLGRWIAHWERDPVVWDSLTMNVQVRLQGDVAWRQYFMSQSSREAPLFFWTDKRKQQQRPLAQFNQIKQVAVLLAPPQQQQQTPLNSSIFSSTQLRLWVQNARVQAPLCDPCPHHVDLMTGTREEMKKLCSYWIHPTHEFESPTLETNLWLTVEECLTWNEKEPLFKQWDELIEKKSQLKKLEELQISDKNQSEIFYQSEAEQETIKENEAVTIQETEIGLNEAVKMDEMEESNYEIKYEFNKEENENEIPSEIQIQPKADMKVEIMKEIKPDDDEDEKPLRPIKEKKIPIKEEIKQEQKLEMEDDEKPLREKKSSNKTFTNVSNVTNNTNNQPADEDHLPLASLAKRATLRPKSTKSAQSHSSHETSTNPSLQRSSSQHYYDPQQWQQGLPQAYFWQMQQQQQMQWQWQYMAMMQYQQVLQKSWSMQDLSRLDSINPNKATETNKEATPIVNANTTTAPRFMDLPQSNADDDESDEEQLSELAAQWTPQVRSFLSQFLEQHITPKPYHLLVHTQLLACFVDFCSKQPPPVPVTEHDLMAFMIQSGYESKRTVTHTNTSTRKVSVTQRVWHNVALISK